MAELNTKQKKRDINWKPILIVAGVLVAVIIFFALFGFLNKSNTPAKGPTANVGRTIDGGQKSYQGETLQVDQDVKNQKREQIQTQREQAQKNDTTHLESLPADAKFIDPNKSGADVKAVLNTDFIPCVTTNYDADGFDCTTKLNKFGFDKNGFDKNGFDKNGCNKEGKDVAGNPCGRLLPKVDKSCLDKIDPKTCEEINKYDADGYDKNGCDRQGYNRAGYSCAPPFCDRQGFDKDGFNCKTGFGRDGFDKNGCDKEGYNREGFNCKTGLDREGYDKDGYDKNGFNRQGCNRQGKDRNGNACGAKKDDKISLNASDMLWFNDELKRKTAFMQEMQKQMDKDNNGNNIAIHMVEDPEAVAKAKEEADKEKETVAVKDVAKKDDAENSVVQVPVGSMVYAFFDAGVNSDYPGMVRAKVAGGPLDGALFTGKATVPFANVTYMPRDKMQAKFDRMVFKRITYTVDAVGLDSGTATDYIEASVDNHYLTRWGGLVGATFLKGFGQAVQTNKTSNNVDQYGNAAVFNQALTSTGDQAKAALGEVGSELATIAKSYFDRPPTVTKEQGEQMLVFFNSELKDDRLPMLFSREELVEHNMTQALNPNFK